MAITDVMVVMVLDDRFTEKESVIRSLDSLNGIDNVLLIENATKESLRNQLINIDGKLNIIRLEQQVTMGNALNQAFGWVIKSNPNISYVLLVSPDTLIDSKAIESLKDAISLNPDEISCSYGDLIIDKLFTLHQHSFNRLGFTGQNQIMLPLLINLAAIKEMVQVNPTHPIIDTNMEIHLVYDLLLRLTQNSIAMHVPKIIASIRSQKYEQNLEQAHFQYLQNKYAQQQVQT